MSRVNAVDAGVVLAGWQLSDAVVFEIAEAVAKSSTCTRSQVGAVLLDGAGHIRGVGYNSEQPVMGCDREMSCALHCPRAQSDVPHGSDYDNGPGTCIAMHAEEMARQMALASGLWDMHGWIMYVTREPCYKCTELLKQSGIHSAWKGQVWKPWNSMQH